jgi:hypothetical protein
VAVFAVVARASMLAAVAVALAWPAAATGHGPCGICLSRSSGPPGSEVTITHRTAYRVVWNGRGLPHDGALRPAYRRREETIELVRYEVRAARLRVRFTVPDVPAGSYPIVIYDGSESGHHYTWDPFRVTADDRGATWSGLAGSAAAAAALFLVAYGVRRLRRQPSES